MHPENEIRLLSITVTDTPQHTGDILRELARDESGSVDFERWHALQTWLNTAEHRVSIPYALKLAELIPPVAVRLRRDFTAILNLIKAHAILHQATRERDDTGRIVATLQDYAVVRDLVADLVAEGVEATVPDTVRETVAAVEEYATNDGISVTRLATLLRLDKSATGRRTRSAISKKPPRPQLPAAPKTLSVEAKRWWKSILQEFDISDKAGLLLLQTCLEAFTRMRQAQELLDAEGLTTVDRYGQHKAHPACAVERDQRAQMLAALKALTPLTRISQLYPWGRGD